MTLLTTWPVVANDLGDRISGTVWDSALHAASKTAIETLVHSVANPTCSPVNTTDEVVTARGTLATLVAFHNVSHNADGTQKADASLASLADVQSLVGHGNWVYNDDFLIWAAGDAAAPTGHTLIGAGASVARCGAGLGDTNTKVGPFCMLLTRAAADAASSHVLMSAASFAAAGEYFKGRKFGFGCWLQADIGTIGRLDFLDGTTTTSTAYHTGDGTWQWLSGVHTVSALATYLAVRARVVNSAGGVHFSGLTVIPGNQAPGAWVPCPKARGTISWGRHGAIATGTILDQFIAARPLRVEEVALRIGTAPGTQAVIVDVNVYVGGYQSMFTTKPQIAAGALNGSQIPDGTYQYRCLTGSTAGTPMLDWDIDQVGVGPTGSDLYTFVRCLQYNRPQESMLVTADF